MAITRTRLEFENHFVQIPNGWMRDKRISRRARGLLAEIMTHDVGWSLTAETLTSNGPEGRDAIRKTIIELEAAGYLTRRRQKDAQGKFGGVDYILTDPLSTVILPGSVENVPMTENPTLENEHEEPPMTENPTLDNPTLDNRPLRTPSLKEDQSKEEGGETFMGNSPRREDEKDTPWNDLHGGGLAPAAPVDGATHPDRCAFHQGAQFPPPCRGCKQAREIYAEKVRAEHHERVLADRKILTEATAERRRKAAECDMCDDDGYRNGTVCQHDPEHPDRVRRGVELLRNSLAQK